MSDSKNVFELPILKDDNKNENLSGSLMLKCNKILLLSFLVVFIIFFLLIILFFNREKVNNVVVQTIEVVNYYKGSDEVDIAIIPSTNQEYCSVVEDKDVTSLNFQKIVNGRCYVTVPLKEQYVYFKDNDDIISDVLVVTDYVVSLEMEDKYYLTLGKEKALYNELIVVGNPDVSWMTEFDGVISVNENSFSTKELGNTVLKAVLNNKIIAETNIVVTDVITEVPEKFDDKKDFLSCEVFTSDEAILLDEILAYRIEQAGYGTRAGAVAAARFLTLEFPYRISYYWESGRLNNTGKHYVDGEGRYYHTGLYLDSSKYDFIEASLFGPAMWGCKLMSYEDDPPNFIPGVKYPNGLDCSGFVSWALLNGGFDVGDRGAGDLPSDGQLTDLGDFRVLTDELINSGKIKVGDLFNFWGHISILIGQDEKNFYIAESLNDYKGLIAKTYAKKSVNKTFKYVVLMDEVYNGDGNITDMWY